MPEKNGGEPQALMQPPLAHFVKLDRPTFLVFSPALPLSQTRSQETRVQETPSSLSPGPSPALAWPGPPDQGLAQPTWIYTRPGPSHPANHPTAPHPSCAHVIPHPEAACTASLAEPLSAPALCSGPDSSVGSSLLRLPSPGSPPLPPRPWGRFPSLGLRLDCHGST